MLNSTLPFPLFGNHKADKLIYLALNSLADMNTFIFKLFECSNIILNKHKQKSG